MPSAPVIRPAQLPDAQALAWIQVAAWHTAYAGIIPAAYLRRYTHDLRLGVWTKILAPQGQDDPQRQHTTTLVAELQGKVCGFASIKEDPAQAELMAIYVHPDRWGTGLGHTLHQAAIDALSDQGHRRALLWVLAKNTRAQAFYAAHGWSRTKDTTTRVYAKKPLTLEKWIKPLGSAG